MTPSLYALPRYWKGGEKGAWNSTAEPPRKAIPVSLNEGDVTSVVHEALSGDAVNDTVCK